MKTKVFLSMALALLALFGGTGVVLAATPSTAPVTEKLLVFGSGGAAGAYYPAAGALASLVNRNSGDSGIRMVVEPSLRASLDNVNGLLSGKLQLGLVQSDIQSQAMNGQGPFANAKGRDTLRALFSLYSEAFTVVAAKDSGIKTFADLKGKRIAMGNPGSSYRTTAEMYMKEFGWATDDVKPVQDISAEDMGKALCEGRADAFIYAIGHPYGMIQQSVAECGARLISLEGAELTSFMGKHAYYPPAVIPADMYAKDSPAVQTFGPKATVMVSSDLSDESAYFITKTVFENLAAFTKMLPVLAGLTKEEMLKGNSVPLHPGALRYFREAGLIAQ